MYNIYNNYQINSGGIKYFKYIRYIGKDKVGTLFITASRTSYKREAEVNSLSVAKKLRIDRLAGAGYYILVGIGLIYPGFSSAIP